MLKKIITFTLIAVLIISTTISYAATATQTQTTWKDTLLKLELMGVVNQSELNVTGNMSREIFSKIIVNSTGNYELAQSLTGSTTYSDVSKTSEFCGYINAAVNKGFLSALSSGQFKPKNPLNFAQLCTAMVTALGYTSSDIIGTWPNGYIEKAKALGLTTGFSLKSTDSVSTGATITMIGRMLNTDIKKTDTTAADVTLLDSVGLLDDEDNWVYGEPEIAFNFNPNTNKLGNITFKSGIPILRNTYDNSVSPATSTIGETISLSDIEDKDVVYEVYNKLDVLMYYLVVDNKIEGELTSILPSKYSPTSIELDEVSYDLGEYSKINKFNSSNGSFNVEDNISVILGYDGEVVDAYYIEDDNNADYAFVAGTSTYVSDEAADYGTTYYTVDLLHVDGTQDTYKIDETPGSYSWKLVKYSVTKEVDDGMDTVALKTIDYMDADTVDIDTDEEKINDSYITDNVRVFNYTDDTVKIVNWNSLPDGTIPSGKVKYIGTTGEFDDVNVLLTYDVFNERFKNYVVTGITSPINGADTSGWKYGLISGGTSYTYTSNEKIDGATIGCVFKMKMYDGVMGAFDSIADYDAASWFIQAIDNKRIKINNIVYRFSPDVTIYYKNASGSLSTKDVIDLDIDDTYESVRLFADNPFDNCGKVQTIVITGRK